ncbi:MAG: hypothetical protein QM755_19940 [Luteolibacter sp.]
MSAIVIFESHASVPTGHYADKCELWLTEALKHFDRVILVCYGKPAVEIPPSVEIESLGRLSLGGWRIWNRLRSHVNVFRGALKACRLANRIDAPCLLLSATPPLALFAALRLGQPRSSAQILMNLGKDGLLPARARKLFEDCVNTTWMCCNTRHSASSLETLFGKREKIIYLPDPIGEPEVRTFPDRGIHKLFIPGDDDDRRTSIRRLGEVAGSVNGLTFALHQPGLSRGRETFIREQIPGDWTFYHAFAADRVDFESRFLSADAILICYRHDVTFGSGNLVLALMCHRPLLVSRFPGALELAEEFGLIGEFFDESDGKSMAEALDRLRKWSAQKWEEFEQTVTKVRGRHSASAVCSSLFHRLN